ncbi:MAG: hypothetical protein ACREFT_10635 [Acetobacteraceae bacterium]
MHCGKLLECGPTGRIFSAPSHAYTPALLEARPLLDPHRRGGFELYGSVSAETPLYIRATGRRSPTD